MYSQVIKVFLVIDGLWDIKSMYFRFFSLLGNLTYRSIDC
jgi:hypothetical protein